MIGTFNVDYQWPAVLTADFTGDGREDILGLQIDPTTGGCVWWVISSTTGDKGFKIAKWGTWPSGVELVDVRAGDFNGDGFVDISARNASTGNIFVSLTENYGVDLAQFRFSAQLNWGKWSTGTAWRDTTVGDFTGDGKDDLFTWDDATGQNMVAVSTGSAFVTSIWEKWDEFYQVVRMGDFNGDGKDDIAALDSSKGLWKVNISSGATFSEQNWGTWKINATQDVAVGNFN